MDFESKLDDPVSRRIWRDYFDRAERVLKSLGRNQRDEIILELQSHLFSATENDHSNEESTRLLSAIEQLGEPEVYLKPIVADKLISEASKSFNPRNIVHALFYNLFFTTVKRGVAAFALFLVYLISLMLLVTVISKIFIPESVGIFVYESGAWHFGVDFPDGGWTFGVNTREAGDKTHTKELLGYWIIPLGIAISVLLHYAFRALSDFMVKPQR